MNFKSSREVVYRSDIEVRTHPKIKLHYEKYDKMSNLINTFLITFTQLVINLSVLIISEFKPGLFIIILIK